MENGGKEERENGDGRRETGNGRREAGNGKLKLKSPRKANPKLIEYNSWLALHRAGKIA